MTIVLFGWRIVHLRFWPHVCFEHYAAQYCSTLFRVSPVLRAIVTYRLETSRLYFSKRKLHVMRYCGTVCCLRHLFCADSGVSFFTARVTSRRRTHIFDAANGRSRFLLALQYVQSLRFSFQVKLRGYLRTFHFAQKTIFVSIHPSKNCGLETHQQQRQKKREKELLTMITSVRNASRQASRRALSSKRGVVGGGRALGSRRAPGKLPMASTVLSKSSLFRPLFYSTERVLQLRSGKAKADQPKVLYDASNETENCGVGLIASLKSDRSRRVVDLADEMLVRMSHRGGCGCDPASGDGAGELV